MTKIKTLLKRLIRRILMNAAWWTAFGAMTIPIGVLLMVEKPERAGIATGLVMLGFVLLIAGLALTFWEERAKRKSERVRKIREMLSLTILTHIASALGVDMEQALNEEYKVLLSFLDEETNKTERKKNA